VILIQARLDGRGRQNEVQHDEKTTSGNRRRRFGVRRRVGVCDRSGIRERDSAAQAGPHREMVSIVGLGGYHLVRPTLDGAESVRIVRAAIDRGINFLDNCWDYNGSQSEVRMGQALRDGYRQRAFLMTKIDGRDKNTAARGHADGRSGPFAAGGAMEAVLEARKAGKLRYIGFTGHKSPAVHLRMLATAHNHQFRFDTVQMPLNVMDAHYDSFEKNVLPLLVKNDIGILGMKPMGDHIIVESKTVSPVECLHYAMNLPTSVVITGCDSMTILEQAVSAAQSFRPMQPIEVEALLTKTAQAATRQV